MASQACHVHNYCGVVDCVVGCAWGWVELTTSLSSLLGLKNGIFLAGTSTRSPVLGLRPTRGLRCRVRKLPKPRISILSPTRSERTMLSNMVSTMTSLSLRVNSASRETSSIRSAFVIRSLAPSSAWISEVARAWVGPLAYGLDNLLKFQGFCARSFFGSLRYGFCSMPEVAPGWTPTYAF